MRTAPAARRRGVASRLLDHVLAAARERGYTRLSLETGTQDFFAPARALYGRGGSWSAGRSRRTSWIRTARSSPDRSRDAWDPVAFRLMRTPRVAVAATLMTLTLLTACGGGDDKTPTPRRQR